MFTLDQLLQAAERPALYAPGAEFWNDPYISGQLLQAHLAPDTDQASYRPATIAAICAYLPKKLGLAQGASLVDLGCGPGLYCAALSSAGCRVTGIDRSQSSLAYARAHAPQARFVQASYLAPFGDAAFDAAVMISQDYGVLPPQSRQTLLQNIRAALRPGGGFAFDVPSLRALQSRAAQSAKTWYAADGGLFRPHRHVVLQSTPVYPEQNALCDVYTVFDTEAAAYRFWQTFFSPETIRAEVEACGLHMTDVLSDLTGAPYEEGAEALGVICRKA